MSGEVDVDVDVVVAGAGGGLIGALRAAQLGASVLVVEASKHYLRGNNTSMCTAMIPGVGTRWQREAGIEDSPELFASDVEHKTHGTGDLTLATALARISAEMVEWLADDIGLPIELMTDMHYPGHSVDRCHTIPERHGGALLSHLSRAALAHPNIDFLMPARLTDVELDASGRVIAAAITDPDGTVETISTKAVLVATNGYGADREMVEKYMPDIAAARYHGSETSRGDALRIGQRLGAASAYLDAYQGHAALSAQASTLLGWATIMHGGVMIDQSGHRFGKETSGYSEFGPLLAARPGAIGWIVYDQRVHDLCLPFTDFRNCIDAGAEVWADDAASLARALNLPEDAVVAELAEAGAAAHGKIQDRFDRSYEAPLTAPFAAVKVIPALFHTQGGLIVDGNARVLREDGSAIGGLYASGGAANGISGHGADGYLAGNGLLPAFALAYAAANDATSSVTE